MGLDIQSVLTLSGFGGLALGLAGRELLENAMSSLLIISSRTFDVGDEILFTQVRRAGSGRAGRRRRAFGRSAHVDGCAACAVVRTYTCAPRPST